MKTILVDAVYTFIKETPEGFKINEPMQKMLDGFPNKKIILTNASYDKYEKYGLHNMPYEVFSLSHNPEKTDPQYFKTMLEHFNLNVDDVVYFEHNIDAVKSAESVGIKTFNWDKENGQLLDLENFLITNLML